MLAAAGIDHDSQAKLRACASESVARTKVQAVFGLLNSTPHSASNRDTETTRAVLEVMALDALGLASVT